MSNMSSPGLAEVAQCVRMSLRRILQLKAKKAGAALHDSTILTGAPDALLDSLSLVMFLSELEQEVGRRWGVSLDLFEWLLDKEDGIQTLRVLTAHIHGVLSNVGCDFTPVDQRNPQ